MVFLQEASGQRFYITWSFCVAVSAGFRDLQLAVAVVIRSAGRVLQDILQVVRRWV